MQNKIIGFFKTVGQFVVGKLVEETETHYFLDKAIILVIRGNGITAKPIELINEEPDVSIRQVGALADSNQIILTKYKKDDLLTDAFQLSPNLIEQYNRITATPQIPQNQVETTQNENNEQIVELF